MERAANEMDSLYDNTVLFDYTIVHGDPADSRAYPMLRSILLRDFQPIQVWIHMRLCTRMRACVSVYLSVSACLPACLPRLLHEQGGRVGKTG